MGKTIVAPRPQWELRGSLNFHGVIHSYPAPVPPMPHAEALELERQGLIARVGSRAVRPLSGAERLLLVRGAPTTAAAYLEAVDVGVIFRLRAFTPTREMVREILRLAVAMPRSPTLLEALKLAAGELVSESDRELASAAGLV